MVEVANSRTRIVMAHSAMEWRGLDWGAGGSGFDGLVVVVVAMDQAEGPVPSRLGEEVFGQINEVGCEIIDRGARQAFGAGIVRPVNDEGLSDDVVARYKTP